MQCPVMFLQTRRSACVAAKGPGALHGATPAQVYSLNWNLAKRSLLLSGSWDDSIKLWDLNSPASLATFREHSYCIYAVVW